MSFVISLILVVSITKVECGIPIETSNYDSLNNLSCQIASANSARVTFVYLGHTDGELLRCLYNLHLPVVTLKFNAIGVEKTRNYSSMHILTVVGDVPRRLMQIMLDSQIRHKRMSKYVLLFRVPCEGYLKRFFNMFWASGILNVIALCSHRRIFTYEPFSDDGFRIVSIPPTIEPTKLFYDKLRNLHYYQLRISQFYNPMRSLPLANYTSFRGIDGLLAMTIVERLNATVRFVRNDELYGYERNGTLTGALRDIVTGVTHVGFNARNIDLRYGEFLQPLGKQLVIHLLVPKAPLAPQSLNFIRVFDPLTWCILLCNVLFVGAAFACMQQMVLKLSLASDYVKLGFRNIIAMLFKTAIGDPVDGFHRISSLRQFLITWILFSYVVSSIYLAKMESVFVHPKYEQDINSLSELSRLTSPVYANPNLLDIVKPSVDPNTFEILISKHRSLPDDYDALIQKMAKMSQGNAFVLRRDRANTLIARTYSNENKRPTYHLVKEYLSSIPYSYMVTKGSPFLETFETLHIRCFEHGLLDYFEAGELHNQNIHDDNYPTEEEDDDDNEKYFVGGLKRRKRAVVLDMNILQGAFYFWSIGISFGCLGFMAELIYWKRHCKETCDNVVPCEELPEGARV